MARCTIQVSGVEEFESLREEVHQKAAELSELAEKLSMYASNLRLEGVLDAGTGGQSPEIA